MSKKKPASEAVENTPAETNDPSLILPPGPVKISKGVISGDSLNGWWEVKAGNRHFEDSRKSDGLIHQDLRDAFRSLAPHLVLLCDTSEAVKLQKFLKKNRTFNLLQMPDDITDDLMNISVSSFSISGQEDGQQIVISGSKAIGSKSVNLTTPKTGYEDIRDPYEFIDELGEAIENCKNEVYKYLFEGKEAMKQLDMFEDVPEGDLVEMQ